MFKKVLEILQKDVPLAERLGLPTLGKWVSKLLTPAVDARLAREDDVMARKVHQRLSTPSVPAPPTDDVSTMTAVSIPHAETEFLGRRPEVPPDGGKQMIDWVERQNAAPKPPAPPRK